MVVVVVVAMIGTDGGFVVRVVLARWCLGGVGGGGGMRRGGLGGGGLGLSPLFAFFFCCRVVCFLLVVSLDLMRIW